MKNQERLKFLYQQFLANNLTEQEIEELFVHFQTPDEKELNFLIRQEFEQTEAETNASPMEEILLDRVHAHLKDHIHSGDEKNTNKRRLLIYGIAAAASILLCISIGTTYYLMSKQQPGQQIVQHELIDIKPGSKKATLILSNGKMISLNDVRTGMLAQQGNTTVTKSADGRVVYHQNKSDESGAIVYNTITTPRAGYYPLTMADGTVAILDAESSIKYPVSFNKTERMVEVTGQVYFEVKYNSAQPFRIKVKGQTIEDLGTKFNVNAYDDEPSMKTTLIEGSVRITKEKQTVVLKPGQQATTELNKNTIQVQAVDTEDAIAWKNGQTSFKNENIEEIMRQAGRWYNLDVRYQGQPSKRQFIGGISRTANLSDLLKILEFNNVHYKISGNTITITP
ncbi:FecR family protein [Pedobacter sp. L105]|uniref:FecR family protein n=1 Tax=Pedobacter sp. L105 TaxID=1641871 RepID=UPI00131D915A|nr:FecR domain-containing protein [Pedobacter sp. L105]